MKPLKMPEDDKHTAEEQVKKGSELALQTSGSEEKGRKRIQWCSRVPRGQGDIRNGGVWLKGTNLETSV